MTDVDVSFINDTGRSCYIQVWNSGWNSAKTHAGISNGHTVFFHLEPDFYNLEFIRPPLHPGVIGATESESERFTPFLNIPVIVGPGPYK